MESQQARQYDFLSLCLFSACLLTGVLTAWSLTYLFLNMRKSLTRPRHPVSLALTSVTMASATLYGTEYFVLQDDSESTSEHH